MLMLFLQFNDVRLLGPRLLYSARGMAACIVAVMLLGSLAIGGW